MEIFTSFFSFFFYCFIYFPYGFIIQIFKICFFWLPLCNFLFAESSRSSQIVFILSLAALNTFSLASLSRLSRIIFIFSFAVLHTFSMASLSRFNKLFLFFALQFYIVSFSFLFRSFPCNLFFASSIRFLQNILIFFFLFFSA